MPRRSKYSPELRERAARLVFDHAHEHPSQWATIRSVAEKLGCTVEALRRWVRQAERDAGTRPGLTTSKREELKRLQRENFELKRERAPLEPTEQRRDDQMQRKHSTNSRERRRCSFRTPAT